MLLQGDSQPETVAPLVQPPETFAPAGRLDVPGRTVFEAIHEVGLRRSWPIILATLTTFGGLIPIILETSNQAPQLIPMAISLGVGIVFATPVILVVVSCLYMILEDMLSGGETDTA